MLDRFATIIITESHVSFLAINSDKEFGMMPANEW